VFALWGASRHVVAAMRAPSAAQNNVALLPADEALADTGSERQLGDLRTTPRLGRRRGHCGAQGRACRPGRKAAAVLLLSGACGAGGRTQNKRLQGRAWQASKTLRPGVVEYAPQVLLGSTRNSCVGLHSDRQRRSCALTQSCAVSAGVSCVG
jgi:hypothetical protein